MVAKKTSKSTAKKITPIKVVSKSASRKKTAATTKKVAKAKTTKPAPKKVAPIRVAVPAKKRVSKPKANPLAKEVNSLKDLVVRLAYANHVDITTKSVDEVENWAHFVKQLETRIEGALKFRIQMKEK